MKGGSLVGVLKDPKTEKNNPGIDPGSVGLVVEWTCHGQTGPLSSCWVQWAGKSDWDCMFTEDLEVLSEAR